MTDSILPSASCRRGRYRRAVLFLTLAAMGFLIASWLDQVAFRMAIPERLQNRDWFRMFRVMGSMWPWLLVAMALVQIDTTRMREGLKAVLGRGLLLLVSAGVSGALAEGLKLLIRRERPSVTGGGYAFRPWSDHPWSTSNLGLPSSHAAVAFGAAWMLCYLYPRAAPVWLAMAVGCAATRVLDKAHFVSDAYVAAVLALVVAWGIWKAKTATETPREDENAETMEIEQRS